MKSRPTGSSLEGDEGIYEAKPHFEEVSCLPILRWRGNCDRDVMSRTESRKERILDGKRSVRRDFYVAASVSTRQIVLEYLSPKRTAQTRERSDRKQSVTNPALLALSRSNSLSACASRFQGNVLKTNRGHTPLVHRWSNVWRTFF
uniref:Uncharacterized protein n=1 Tax=Pseudictyota dubia TaxID=2749911 RepID=A0A7R9VWR5_9STRA|mmetsp:Transcript_24357/g.45058  ORF Transcript_24357/g.45058 Transcript_24357/m.45058 type:complete len:146 (+) Transcript_24357:58-495(+)